MKKSFWIVWLLICVSLSAVVVGCGEGDPAVTTAPSVTTTAPTVITTAPTAEPTAPIGGTTAPTVPTAAPTAPTVTPTAPTVTPPAPTTKPTEPAPTTKPTEPAPTTKPTEPAPTTKPTEPAPTTKPTEPAPTTKPTEPAPTTKPTEPAPTTKPTEPAPTTKPTEPAPTTKPTEPTPTTRPTEPEETTQPTEPENPNIIVSYYDEQGRGYLEPIPNPVRKQVWEYDDQKRPVNRRMFLVKTGATLEMQFWYYNKDGSREEFEQYNDENDVLISQTTRKWDKNGWEIYYSYHDSTGNAKETVETTYYPDGTRRTVESWTPDSGHNLWSKTEYHSNGNIAREEYSRVHNETGWSTYWENGNLKESEEKKQAGGGYYIECNEQGVVIYAKNIADDNQSVSEQWNDDQGNPLKMSTVDINGVRTVIEFEKGKEVKHTIYLADGKTVYSEVTTTYHDNGNMHEKKYWDIDGNSSLYVFRADATLEKMESASADGSASEHRYYADGSTVEREIVVDVSGVKTEKHFTEAGKLHSSTETRNDGTRIETSYNANEQPVERLMYNKSGVLQSKTSCRYNSSGNWLSEEETEYYENGTRTLNEYDKYGRNFQSFMYEGDELVREQFNRYFGESSSLVWKVYIYNKDRSYSLTTYYENGVISSYKEFDSRDTCTLQIFYDEEGNVTSRTGT